MDLKDKPWGTKYVFLIDKIIKTGAKMKYFTLFPLIISTGSEYEKKSFFFELKKMLSKEIPFSKFSGVFNSEEEAVQLNEILKFQKKSIGIKISDCIEFYEGEVTDFVSNFKTLRSNGRGFHAILGLQTLEGKLRLKVSGEIYNELIINKVKIGDIIRIIPETFSVENLGKSNGFIKKNSIDSTHYLTLPRGKVFKKKTITKEITLYEFELENFKNIKNFEISNYENISKLNEDTEALLLSYNKRSKIEIFKGVLFIDEVHNLNLNCIRYINKVFNHRLFPFVIITTNKIDWFNCRQFSLDNFNLIHSSGLFTIPLKKFSRDEILEVLCWRFLKQKKFISGKGVRVIKNFLLKSNLDFCLSLISLSYIAATDENLCWICKNTLEFFNLIILGNTELLRLISSKNNFIKIHRSF